MSQNKKYFVNSVLNFESLKYGFSMRKRRYTYLKKKAH